MKSEGVKGGEERSRDDLRGEGCGEEAMEEMVALCTATGAAPQAGEAAEGSGGQRMRRQEEAAEAGEAGSGFQR